MLLLHYNTAYLVLFEAMFENILAELMKLFQWRQNTGTFFDIIHTFGDILPLHLVFHSVGIIQDGKVLLQG